MTFDDNNKESLVNRESLIGKNYMPKQLTSDTEDFGTKHMKNNSPRNISLQVSAIIALSILSLLLFFNYLLKGSISWIIPLLTCIAIFVISYFFIVYTLEKFIYSKIKLIYKTIHHLKAPSEDSRALLRSKDDIISKVNQEVISWAENQSKEIDQLKKNVVYRREFVSNVSHELKTPIFNIEGYLHTLIDGGMDDPKINKEYLYKAVSNVDRLSAIVNDLEVISQLESGDQILEIEKFDMSVLVQEVFEAQEMQADANDVNLSFKAGQQKKVYVMADKEMIRQVLVNLITNSIKYGKENGHTYVDFDDMDENLLIEISDDGIGIDEKNLPRLFERFFRVDKSRSRERGGTGLGLSIVKHIIEAHKQTISVRSKAGEGTTFGFTLQKG